MKVTLQLPYELYEAYLHHADCLAGRGKQVSAEDLMVKQLDRFSKVAPMDRVVVVETRPRAGLEKILAGGFITSGEDLLKRVRRLADLKIGGIQVDFTTRQWEQVKNYATRNRITPDEAALRIVRGMEQQFFDIAG